MDVKKRKYVIFGGFDYVVRWEMDQDAIYRGIDYFVDNDPELIGTSYLGKPIYAPDKLLEEPRGGIFILIGSIVYHTELEFQLLDMGFEKGIDFSWAIAPPCKRHFEDFPLLWKRYEWNDEDKNAIAIRNTSSEEARQNYYVVSKMLSFDDYKTVIDLGAASECIREFIPDQWQGKYIPIDYMKYTDHTMVIDLNKDGLPSFSYDRKHTCILMISVIVFFEDWKEILRQCASQADHIVISHNDFVRINREWRRTHWTYNTAIFNHEIILYMQDIGFRLVEAHDFHLRRVIMKFERRGL